VCVTCLRSVESAIVSNALYSHTLSSFTRSLTIFVASVEGYGIQDVMGKPGVDGKNTKTNHIVEVSLGCSSNTLFSL
jgi:hypothetical protein